MIPAITEVNFPSYATLSQATVSLTEMGDRTISTQVKIDGDIVPSFDNWELRFKGERFILPVKEPQAAKDNTSRRSIIDLSFESWAVFQLKRYFFVSMSEIETGVAIPDQYNASIMLSLENFVQLFNKVLKYYFGDEIRMDLFGAGQGIYSTEPVAVEINKTYIWDVLVKFHELFDVRWTIEYDSQTSAYVIKVGYTAEAITDHDFEYGYQGGLLKFERQVQDTQISNILVGRGGEKNIPYRYFKLQDPNNTAWAADPDAIPELANIYFDRLRDINFRWYVRGWMQNSHRDTSWDSTHTFPTYTDSDCPEEFQFAFHKGQTDEKFNPVEYVKDDASITKYGERWGAVDDNDEVYPTIQGITRSGLGRIDEVVSVSPIITDDIQAAARAAVQVNELTGTKTVTHNFSANQTHSDELRTEVFTVPSGQTGNINYSIMNPHNGKTGQDYASSVVALNTGLLNIKAVDVATGVEYAPSGLTAGDYYLKFTLAASNYTSQDQGPATYGFNSLELALSSVDENAWKPTFDIWVKNIWGTTQGSGESDQDYATRVWQSILGDRAGNEAKIVFSDGFMSVSEDYEFVIASYPVPDRSKTITSGGVNYDSEWRITLYKNDAEFQATSLYIPNATTGGSPSAGDHFFFIGIDMPFQYVEWAEEALNGALATPVINKTAALNQYAEINPSWIITLDKVRCNTHEGSEYGQHLADRLAAGATVRIKDRRFTNGQVLTLYVQSITYTWNEPTNESPYIVPDIEVVLSDKIVSVEGTVSRMSSELEVVKTTYAKSADIEQTVRSVGNSLFLKKTGESDNSQSPTTFSSKVSSKNFRKGDIGGAGWGMYQEAPEVQASQVQTRSATRAASTTEAQDGNAVFEVDKLIVRKELHVNELIANQISYVGGKKITSAAAIECTQVVEDDNYYFCYFDQKQGTVANLFKLNDVAMGQNFDEENVETRYYRMVVSQVGVDYIRLSKSSRDGSGAPMKGDIIVQYGNLTDASRRYVIVEDVIGGGYQRMIAGLNSTHAAGKEYYFAGRENISGSGSGSGSGAGDGTRWFVGDSLREYAEWKNGQLNIKGNILVRKGDNSYASMGYLADALPLGGATLIQGGLILTSMMQLGYTANEVYTVMAGINGVPNTSLSDQTMSIAAWFGGDMEDIEHPTTGSTLTPAKSLFRMDGSGYLASGKITWGKLGGGHIPGLTWNDAGTSITIGGGGNSSVIIDGSVKLVNSSGNDISDLISLVQELSNMFEDETYLDGSTTKHRIKVKSGYEGLYANGFISAGGPSSGSGGGGGGVTPEGMWDMLSQPTSYPINISHLPYTGGTGISISSSGVISYTGAAGGVTSVAGLTGDITSAALINALGLSSALKFRGTTTTDIKTNPTTNPITIGGQSYTAQSGDVVVISGSAQEYMWNGSSWQPIGDESSYALKTVSITGTGYLTGGGTLEQNRTIDIAQTYKTKIDNGATAYGYFTSDVLGVANGGTGLSSIAAYSLLYASAANTLAALAPNATATKKFLTMTGTGSAGAAPAWGTVGITDVLGTTAKGSASMPIYYTGSALAEITSLDLLSKNTGYVKANRFYLNATTYFEIDSNGYVHLVVPSGKGFYTEGFVSAGGASSGSGGGGGGGITPLGMWQLLTNDSTITTYGDNTAIALAHLGAVQTWVGQQGYATQTWVGQQGYATQTWVGQQNYIDRTVLWKQLQNNDNVDHTHDNDQINAAHLTNYVTLNSTQTITEKKTFQGGFYVIDGASSWSNVYRRIPFGNGSDISLIMYSDQSLMYNPATGRLKVSGGYAVDNGTSAGFLKANGTVDTTSYLSTTSAQGLYLPITGGTLKNARYAEQLIIWRDHATNDAVIRYMNNSGVLGDIGYRGSDGKAIVSYNSSMYEIYHSGNSNLNSVPWTTSTLDSYGNISVHGSANTNNDLSIIGSQYTMSLRIGSGNVNRGLYDTTGSQWMLYFDANNTILNYGAVGIGTSPAFKLDVYGLIHAPVHVYIGTLSSDPQIGDIGTVVYDSSNDRWINFGIGSSSHNRGLYANEGWLYYIDTSGNKYLKGDHTVLGSLSATGNMTLYTSGSEATPALIFQRGTLSDNYNDWRIQNNNGRLLFELTNNVLSDWTTTVTINSEAYGYTLGTSSCFIVGEGYSTLDVSGSSHRKIYFGSTDYYIELDANGYFHFGHPSGKGLYVDGFVSAGGLSPTSSSGGGINETALWEILGRNSGDGYNKLIHTAHLPTAYANNGLSLAFNTTLSNDTISATSLTVGVDANHYLPTTSDQTNWNAKVSASALNDYLPLSFTNIQNIILNGNLDTVVAFCSGRTDSVYVKFITSDSSVAGYIGMTSTNGLTFWDTARRTIYHSGNLSPVDIGSTQTITGVKTFSNGIYLDTSDSWSSTYRNIPFGSKGTPTLIRYIADSLMFNPSTGILRVSGGFAITGGYASSLLTAAGGTNTPSDVINNLTTGSSTPVDGDYYVAQYVNGGTTTTTYHRRPHYALYNYMKGKMDSVYAPIVSGGYLPLSGGTMSGGITLVGGSSQIYCYADSTIYSMLYYNSTISNGTQYIGIPLGTTRIRSGAESLLHDRGGTLYTILDTRNFVAGTDYVSISGAETITGAKTFYGGFYVQEGTSWSNTYRRIPFGHGSYPTLIQYSADALLFNPNSGKLKVSGGFAVDNGTSSQFLKADGSLDSTTYVTTTSAQTISGEKTFTGNVSLSTTNFTGHLYLTGAQSSSSTGNTTQIVFGTSSSQYIALSSNTYALILNPATNDTTQQTIIGCGGHDTYFNGGNFGIGGQPSYKLHVFGVAYASTGIFSSGYVSAGGVSSSSDIRMKNDVHDVTGAYALSLLMRMRPKEWIWNDKHFQTGKKSAGLIAQDMETILPFSVTERDSYKYLEYNVLHAYEIAGLQNHETRLEAAEREIVELKRENAELKARLNA